ncbi:MAG: prepilin-type N-terminal cleavage/methylation domain-containing protein [Candidatus Omnitrophica bacterium]|nr:prepilin-type N-terminal cleavage/methylation domain-containing protein [Candidatus Omnitrophota bacterium]
MCIKKLIPNGFTLPELLMSAAILSFCLSGLLATFISSTALNDSTRNLLTATTHAEFVMESIKNVAFVNIPSNQGGAAWNAWSFNTAGVTGMGLTALNNETISTTLTAINPIDVTVTVSWSDKGGRARNILLRTLIAG